MKEQVRQRGVDMLVTNYTRAMLFDRNQGRTAEHLLDERRTRSFGFPR